LNIRGRTVELVEKEHIGFIPGYHLWGRETGAGGAIIPGDDLGNTDEVFGGKLGTEKSHTR
jgi:hypothetical protein